MKKDNRKYYAAYEERYKTAHANGVSWSSDVNTPIVMEVIDRYKIRREHKLLEIGCGEGRDSRTVLDHGFPLMPTDISEEAIAYCRRQMPRYEKHFRVLDCLSARLDEMFDTMMKDDEKGKELTSNGTYVDRRVNAEKLDSQELFYEMAYKNAEKKTI